MCADCGTCQNIIPVPIGTVKDVGKVTPEPKGMLTGKAFHVPTPSVSVVDLTCHLEKAARYNDIQKVEKQAFECSQKACWATLRTRLSLKSSTVLPTLRL